MWPEGKSAAHLARELRRRHLPLYNFISLKLSQRTPIPPYLLAGDDDRLSVSDKIRPESNSFPFGHNLNLGTCSVQSYISSRVHRKPPHAIYLPSFLTFRSPLSNHCSYMLSLLSNESFWNMKALVMIKSAWLYINVAGIWDVLGWAILGEC